MRWCSLFKKTREQYLGWEVLFILDVRLNYMVYRLNFVKNSTIFIGVLIMLKEVKKPKIPGHKDTK